LTPSETDADSFYLDIQFGGEILRQKRVGNDILTYPDNDHWFWWNCDDFSDWETDEVSQIVDFQPVSGFQIAIHIQSLATLAFFLQCVLNAYGGIVFWYTKRNLYKQDNPRHYLNSSCDFATYLVS